MDAAVSEEDGMHAGLPALLLLGGVIEGGEELEEHGEDGDDCEDGDVADYRRCGIGCADSEGSDISDEYLCRESVKEVHGEGSSDYSEEDYG